LTKHVIDSTELISLVNGSNGFNVLPLFNYQVGPLPSVISQIVRPSLDRYFHLGRPVNTRSTIKFAKLISLTFSECFLSSSVSSAESEIKRQLDVTGMRFRHFIHPPHQQRLVHISRPRHCFDIAESSIQIQSKGTDTHKGKTWKEIRKTLISFVAAFPLSQSYATGERASKLNWTAEHGPVFSRFQSTGKHFGPGL
jgi:hypothetical protein